LKEKEGSFMTGNYANIIVEISHEKVDRPFQYKIPEEFQNSIEPGDMVLIPFGAGNKLIHGCVMEITDKNNYPVNKLKDIAALEKNRIGPEEIMIKLAWWMKETYGSTMSLALKTVLPVKTKEKHLEHKTVSSNLSKEELLQYLEERIPKNAIAQRKLLEAFLEVEEMEWDFITKKMQVTSQVIKALVEKKVLLISCENKYRSPVHIEKKQYKPVVLSKFQQDIVDTVINDLKNHKQETYLLHGITGSGKTEVYMELIQYMLEQKKQVIMLIPEIALTYQTLFRFYQRFGDLVSVMNSKLSKGERFDQFERARKGEISIMIGPRSALFTPFKQLGLILIDEEHETSYKSETMPKYHAREVALQLAKLTGACVFLGSATPSLEAFCQAKEKRFTLFQLSERLTGQQLAKVYTVDLREELKEGNRSIFSRKLRELMEERLANKEQIMLFLNRRGYSGFVSCRSCGHVMKCPHCEVSLSEHNNKRLICHYCGYSEEMVKNCPVCSSSYISGFRAGTQQIEEQLKRYFPTARVLRMDADTTRNKDQYEQILSAFANEEADILIGTQMIVKGHDFKNVTLVGILAADLSLAVNDYRASERTFQLLTQAAGRAGRGKKEGEVVIQTYQPEHYSVQYAAKQDYEGFYEEEMSYRKMLRYPPAASMAAVLISGLDEETVGELAKRIAVRIKMREQLSVMGPAPATVKKINDIYRYMIYLKHPEYQVLVEIKNEVEQYVESLDLKKETIQFDFNPMSAY
jgi:primosomal protein N' (replication factor Y) (superfamily II helicase)